MVPFLHLTVDICSQWKIKVQFCTKYDININRSKSRPLVARYFYNNFDMIPDKKGCVCRDIISRLLRCISFLGNNLFSKRQVNSKSGAGRMKARIKQ
jgi:hypothetical protein